MGVQDRDWYSEAIRQRERSTHGPSMPQPRPGTVGGSRAVVRLLALGVVLFAAMHAYSGRQARVAAEESARTAQHNQLQAEQRQRSESETQQVRQAELDRQEAIRWQTIRDRQQVTDRVTQSSAAEMVRRQQAWNKFYRPSAFCIEAGTVECANAFIRARRLFEQEYARGAI